MLAVFSESGVFGIFPFPLNNSTCPRPLPFKQTFNKPFLVRLQKISSGRMTASRRPQPNPPDKNSHWKTTPMEESDCIDIAGWMAALSLDRQLEAPLMAAQLRDEFRRARKQRYPDFRVVFKQEEKIGFFTGRLTKENGDYKIHILTNPFGLPGDEPPAKDRFHYVLHEIVPFIFFKSPVNRILIELDESDTVRKNTLEALRFKRLKAALPLKANYYWWALPRSVYFGGRPD